MNKKLLFKRILFYIVSFTWGSIMSLMGLIVIAFSACFKRVHSYHGRLYAVWGKNWGGLELGCFFIIGKNNEDCCAHEAGHGIQNLWWGPLFIFVIWIPSAIRYWYRELKYYKRMKFPPTNYDDIWFEGQATRLGKNLVEKDKI